MKRRHAKYRHLLPPSARRRGLAPLEFVLCLPILLMLMALMINFGTVASWKVRSLGMSRDALWSTRWPRNGGTNPRPDFWPAGAGAGTVNEDDVEELDDTRARHPVVRGPLPMGTQVNEHLLDPGRGMRQGTATITRGYPMLGSLGEYELNANTYLLDDKWQHRRMGLASTHERRIPVIYELAKAPPAVSEAYTQAVMNVINAPFADDLRPMDNDDEYRYYGERFGWSTRSPDFYPRLRRFCSFDPDVADERVEDLVDRIQGKREDDDGVSRRVPSVAETMTRAFISLYERVIRAIESGGTQPLPPGATAEIAALRKKIDTLNEFLQTLQQN